MMTHREEIAHKRISHIFEVVDPLIVGKRLLDVGCIGHDLDFRMENGTFYFDHFQKLAEDCKGIDILDKAVENAQRLGHNVVLGNAETYFDGSAYDVIFAGELIEHLNNPGNFLNCSRKNLSIDGVLVLTTPNTFSLAHLLRALLRLTNEPPVNPEHTFYFTPKTLSELTRRHGFRVRSVFYSDYDYGSWPHNFAKRVGLKINSFICRILPKFSQSFIVVLELDKLDAVR